MRSCLIYKIYNHIKTTDLFHSVPVLCDSLRLC